MFRRNRRGDDQAGQGSDAAPGDTGDLGELDEDVEFDDDLDDQFDDDELDDDELDADDLDDDELADAGAGGYAGSGSGGHAGPAGEDQPPAAARRRAAPAAGRHDLGDPATWTRMRDRAAAAPAAPAGESGPWDGAGDYPDTPRMDFGSILVPMRDGLDIQVNLDEQAGMWIAVVHRDSALQLQAFAAPKSAGIWDDVRAEIVSEVTKAGGASQDASGPFGPELLARLTPPGAPPQALRFMGVDGPRWFLRGLISGPAAANSSSAALLEEIFADVVVVRGDHPEPPRKALEIRLPDEARQALEQQAQAEAESQGEGEEQSRFSGQGMPNPFERGPEITETR